jgi:hypothetical protein
MEEICYGTGFGKCNWCCEWCAHVCTLDGLPFDYSDCPSNTTSATGAATCVACAANSGTVPVSNVCVCDPQYYRNTGTCIACPAGLIKPARGDHACMTPCLVSTDSTSPAVLRAWIVRLARSRVSQTVRRVATVPPASFPAPHVPPYTRTALLNRIPAPLLRHAHCVEPIPPLYTNKMQPTGSILSKFAHNVTHALQRVFHTNYKHYSDASLVFGASSLTMHTLSLCCLLLA